MYMNTNPQGQQGTQDTQSGQTNENQGAQDQQAGNQTGATKPAENADADRD